MSGPGAGQLPTLPPYRLAFPSAPFGCLHVPSRLPARSTPSVRNPDPGCRPGCADSGDLVRFRLTPQDTSFYDMFATSARHLVVGAQLLTEVMGAPREEREALAQKMREAEHAADESTHEIMRRSTPRSSRRSTARTSTRWRRLPRRLHGPDGGRGRPDRAVPDRRAARGRRRAGGGAGPDGRPDGGGHAAPAVDEGPGRVLDRDQPAGEPGGPGLPAAAGRAVRRQPQGDRDHEAQGGRRRSSRERPTPSSRSRTWSRASP